MMEQKKDASAAESKAAESATVDAVTEPKAAIRIEGQEFELDAALARDDKTLKVVLQPHFASIENANITREVKDGKLIVTIVKRAQHKGSGSDDRSPLERLDSEVEQINPAILLAEEFMRRSPADLLSAEEINHAESVLEVGRLEIEQTKRQITAFIRASPSPSSQIPTGF